MNGPLLSRQQLQEALERLAHHLDRRGVHAELYLFGGGAMVLAHDPREATMDLDTAIRKHHGPVLGLGVGHRDSASPRSVDRPSPTMSR